MESNKQKFQKFLIEQKASKRKVLGASPQLIAKYISGTSPTIDKMETILIANGAEPPYLHTGLNDLIEYVKSIAKKNGFKLTVLFEYDEN